MVFGSLTTFGFFLSYKYINFTDAVGISFTAVLFITILSVPVLGEKVGIQRWTAVFIGFLGVLVIVPAGASPAQSTVGFGDDPFFGDLCWGGFDSADVGGDRVALYDRHLFSGDPGYFGGDHLFL